MTVPVDVDEGLGRDTYEPKKGKGKLLALVAESGEVEKVEAKEVSKHDMILLQLQRGSPV